MCYSGVVKIEQDCAHFVIVSQRRHFTKTSAILAGVFALGGDE